MQNWTFKDITQFLIQHFDASDGSGITTTIPSRNRVEIGVVEARYFEQSVLELLDQWVDFVDRQMAKCAKNSTAYLQWLDQRLFTFEEYTYLFVAQRNPKVYQSFPVYAFLMLSSEQERITFIHRKKADHVQDYLNALSPYQHVPLVRYLAEKITYTLPTQEFYKHAYVPGKTGYGKSVLLQNFFYDLQRKSFEGHDQYTQGMAFIDPHGDTAKAIKNFNLNRDCLRLIYIDPYYQEGFVPVINPFEMKVEDFIYGFSKFKTPKDDKSVLYLKAIFPNDKNYIDEFSKLDLDPIIH